MRQFGMRQFGMGHARRQGGGGRTGLEILQSKGAAFFLHDFVGRTDLTFQDSSGITLADDSGEGVALSLGSDQIGDKTFSGALSEQTERVPSTYSGAVSGSWLIGSTTITRNGATSGQATLNLGGGSFDLAKRYVVTFTVADLSGDTFGYRVSAGTARQVAANGVYRAVVPAGGTAASLIFIPWSGTAGQATISLISVKEFPGNHSVQTGATTLRPTRQADGGLKGDRLDDNLLQALTSSTSMFMAAAILGASTPAAVAVIIGGPIGTNRGYLARDAAGKICAGVGADSPTTIVGGSDVAGLKGVAMLNFNASGNVDLEWMPKGGALQSLYSGPINGSVNAITALRLFASNASGSPGNYGGDTLYLASAIQTHLTADERRALAIDWNKRIPA